MIRYIKYSLFSLLVTAFFVTGCDDEFMEEQPRSQLTPAYFESADGIRKGLNALYSHYRYYYGVGSGMYLTVFGTDEFTHGRDGCCFDVNNYAAGLNSQNGQLTGPWNRGYSAINTANGIIDLAGEAEGLGEDERNSIEAQARFIRAHWYFILVRQFGDVTLNTEYVTTPRFEASRDPKEAIYETIINDLRIALEGLPEQREEPGRIHQGAALHLLSKVYLRRGWDDQISQSTDFDSAYFYSNELITNNGTYGAQLLQDYGDVFAQGNENNSEVLLNVQWTSDPQYNEFGVENGLKENRSIYFFRPLYESVQGLIRSQEYGRPWLRFKPTPFLYNQVYSNKTEDSRFDKAFQTVWLANDDPENLPDGMSQGDTALYMPKPGVDTAALPEYTTHVMPEAWQEQDERVLYPSMTKYDDNSRPDIQAPSVRPYIVYKFSETYLVAAEAALQNGDAGRAAELINVLRRRAAWRESNSASENDAAANAMEISEGDVTIDFILNERSRELAGEMMRWYDLTRTNRLLERVRAHNPDASENIQEKHTLRPIPQNQRDLTENDYGDRNPGW